jgi:tripartite ATP-independent transporter DctM subunit
MSAEIPVGVSAVAEAEPQGPRAWPVRILASIQNAIVILTLVMMVLLPAWESIARLIKDLFNVTSNLSLAASTTFVQHGTLVVALMGAALAARENRLLSLATATVLPRGWPRVAGHIFGAAVGGAVGFYLCYATATWVVGEIPIGEELAYGIPAWVVELLLPIGFGLITLGVLYHSSDRWQLRWIAPVLAAGMVLACRAIPLDPETNSPPASLVIVCFVVLALATFLGAPIFVILGGSALILFWGGGSPIASLSIDFYSLNTHSALPTIPLFTLAGYFLAEGGASGRLVRVFSALFGSIRGGPAVVTALLCAFFTSFTGASGVTILALGGVLMPILLSARYTDRAALGLLTGAGSLGMLFPPCLPLVLYAIIADVRIEDIFLGAIVPGLLLVVMTAALGVWMGPRRAAGERRPRFDPREAVAALWEAKWELFIPVVAIVGLFSGLTTPVEASAITALYAFFTQTIFHRDLTLRRGVPHAILECGLVIGGVLLILGVAQGFTNYLIFEQIPQRVIDWLTTTVKSPYVFLLLLNLFLLVVGGLMDVYPAIIVVGPLLVPIGKAYGIDPVHLGVIFLANLEMGFLMPPLGMNLLLSSYRFNKPMPVLYRAILPVLVVQFIAVLLITYVPAMTIWLPQLFHAAGAE